jgi:hypothetical protein
LRRNKCLYPSATVVIVVFMMLSFHTFLIFFPSFDFFPHCVQAINPNEHVTLLSFIGFGSWIGGDRDHNPYGEFYYGNSMIFHLPISLVKST